MLCDVFWLLPLLLFSNFCLFFAFCFACGFVRICLYVWCVLDNRLNACVRVCGSYHRTYYDIWCACICARVHVYAFVYLCIEYGISRLHHAISNAIETQNTCGGFVRKMCVRMCLCVITRALGVSVKKTDKLDMLRFRFVDKPNCDEIKFQQMFFSLSLSLLLFRFRFRQFCDISHSTWTTMIWILV